MDSFDVSKKKLFYYLELLLYDTTSMTNKQQTVIRELKPLFTTWDCRHWVVVTVHKQVNGRVCDTDGESRPAISHNRYQQLRSYSWPLKLQQCRKILKSQVILIGTLCRKYFSILLRWREKSWLEGSVLSFQAGESTTYNLSDLCR